MNTYKLLTPGPLTTTDTVKEEMLVDRCTWDDDYKAVTQKIRRQLLQLGHVCLLYRAAAPSEWRASSPAWWGTRTRSSSAPTGPTGCA